MHAELHHVVYALSDALDLVGVDDVAHGKRVGIMAAACAQALGWSQTEQDFMFELGMLHDIGVSSTQTHQHLVAEFDWVGSQQHTVVGQALLERFEPLADMALPVRYHHTRWPELQALDLPERVALQANLVYLVDRVDTLAAPHYASNSVLFHRQEIRDAIAARAGAYFCPQLVEGFLTASRTEAFWLLLEPRSIQQALQRQLARTTPQPATGAQIRQIAEIFARIVDAKSPFTASHSQGVAQLSRWLAERMGLGPQACDKIEVAGLLHDLGKLRVPDEILDKPAPLDPLERQIINTHSFETFQILRSIEGFDDVAAWAAYHHEEPDGKGYPFHLQGQDLPLEARILRVADIFQAMVQDRPYRRGLDGVQVMAFLRSLQEQGRIEAPIVQAIATDIDGAMAAAKAQVT